MEPSRDARIDPLLVILALGFSAWALVFIHATSFVADSGQTFYCLFDDAMISMRYGWNLSHGQGLVWNPGERIEGYTNPLMTLLMAAATAVTDRRLAVLLIQLTGIVTMLGGGLVAVRVAALLTPAEAPPSRPRLFRRLAFLGALFYYPLGYWTLVGMETGLLAFWLLVAVWFYLRAEAKGGLADSIGFGLAAGLAYLTRPDALVATLPLLVLLLASSVRRPSRREAVVALAAAGAYLVVPAAHLAWRLAYYGEWAPNTYFLKLGGFPLAARLANGTGFVAMFVGETWWALVLALLVTLVGRDRRCLALGAIPAALVAYQVWTGGDAWTLWRFFAPGLPIVFLLAARLTLLFPGSRDAREPSSGSRSGAPRVLLLAVGVGLVAAGAGLAGSGADRRARAVALIVGVGAILTVALARRAGNAGLLSAALVLSAFVAVNLRFAPQLALLRPPGRMGPNAHHVAIAHALDELLTPEGTIGVLWAGTIPYFNGRRAIDFLGKTDSHVARLAPHLPPGPPRWGQLSWLPAHEKYDLEYSIGVLHPTYVQSCRWGIQNACDGPGADYVAVDYRGLTLLLRRGAPEVRWEKVPAAQTASKRTAAEASGAGTEPEP
jgi:hypothetical protein